MGYWLKHFPKNNIAFSFYFFGLCLMVVALPLSKYFTGVSQFIIVIGAILQPDLVFRFKTKVKQNKSFNIYLLIVIVHLLGLIYTEDFNYALKDLKVKVPLFLFPLAIVMSNSLNKNQFILLFKLLLTALFFSSLISTGLYLKNNYAIDFFKFVKGRAFVYDDIRDISMFISHIRLSLMIVTVVLLSFFLLKKPKSFINYSFYGMLAYLVLFLFILQSFTGIFILFLLSVLVSFYYLYRYNRKLIYYLFIPILVIVFSAVAISFYSVYKNFIPMNDYPDTSIKHYTSKGNEYYFTPGDFKVENGYYTGAFISDFEMQKEWPKRSKIDYYGKNKRGNVLRHTIFRYLTSKGLRKDAEGIQSLTDKDIKNIENGFPNYKFAGYSIKTRIYQIIWQIDDYIKTGAVNGHSLIQRLEYLKTGFYIFKENPIIGVGTGDVKASFKNEYEEHNSKLIDKYRRRAHNQYLTFMLTFGVIGFIVVMFALIYPIVKYKGEYKNVLLIFISIAALSGLNEDTLETQAGVSFFVLFYSVIIFGLNTQKNKKPNNYQIFDANRY